MALAGSSLIGQGDVPLKREDDRVYPVYPALCAPACNGSPNISTAETGYIRRCLHHVKARDRGRVRYAIVSPAGSNGRIVVFILDIVPNAAAQVIEPASLPNVMFDLPSGELHAYPLDPGERLRFDWYQP